jgi:NTP pyrophosphatase (non-canonical NTP hydrolase)
MSHVTEFDAYQAQTATTAIYPEAGQQTLPAITYLALGLAGETGEVVEKIKKLLRDGDSPAKREEIVKEMGDVLYYLARLAAELNVPFSTIAANNLEKLQSRLQRQQLHGNGDNR